MRFHLQPLRTEPQHAFTQALARTIGDGRGTCGLKLVRLILSTVFQLARNKSVKDLPEQRVITETFSYY